MEVEDRDGFGNLSSKMSLRNYPPLLQSYIMTFPSGLYLLLVKKIVAK